MRVTTRMNRARIRSLIALALVGFWLLPALGLRDTFLLLVALNAAAGVTLLLLSTQRDGLPAAGVATAGLAFALFAIPADLFKQTFEARFGRLLMYREQVTDIGCSLRVMRSALLKEVKLFRGMHRFLPTLLALEGARVVEIPVSHRSRRFGRSKYGILERLSVGLRDVFAVRWMKSRNLCYRVSEPGIERGSAAHPQPPAGRSAR